MIIIDYKLISNINNEFNTELRKKLESSIDGKTEYFYFKNTKNDINFVETILLKYKATPIIHNKKHFDNCIIEKVKYYRIYPTWRNGYPAGDDTYLYRYFNYDNESRCRCNIKQTNPISIKRIPKWGKRNFMSLFWLHNILFCNTNTKKILEESQIKGIEFLPVTKGIKTPKVVGDTHQIKIIERIKDLPVYFRKEVSSIERCSICGAYKINHSLDSLIKFNKDKFQTENDIFLVGQMFNFESIIISSKLFYILKENNLLRDLHIKPVFMKQDKNLYKETYQLNEYKLTKNKYKYEFSSGKKGRFECLYVNVDNFTKGDYVEVLDGFKD